MRTREHPPSTTPGDGVLLSDARLVLEPNLYGRAVREARADLCHCGSNPSLDASMESSFCAYWVAAPPASHSGVSSTRGLRPSDRSTPRTPRGAMHEVDQPPPHHAMNRRDRPALDHLGKRPALGITKDLALAWGLAVQQSSGPRASKRISRSRAICKVTPPIRAASLRLPPSYICASASKGRICGALLDHRTRRQRAAPSRSSPNPSARPICPPSQCRMALIEALPLSARTWCSGSVFGSSARAFGFIATGVSSDAEE